MKISMFIAAATIALSSTTAFASTASITIPFDIGGYAEFSASQIVPAHFAQDFSFGGLASGTYNVLGDISSTNVNFTNVTLNGIAWNLIQNSKGKFAFADIDYTGVFPFTLHVEGDKLNSTKSTSFNGSLTVTPVPEVETSSMMLLGLGLMGFVARRRSAK